MHAMEEKEEVEEARDGENTKRSGGWGSPPPPRPVYFAPGDLAYNFAGRPREWHPSEVGFNQPGRR